MFLKKGNFTIKFAVSMYKGQNSLSLFIYIFVSPSSISSFVQ